MNLASTRCNDNLAELKKITPGSVDLVYIDPPFNTGKHQGDYDDRWKSMDSYIEFIEYRLKEIHRVTRNGGTVYVHVDPRASGYVRVMADGIFGRKNFLNEIAWCYKGPSSSKHSFPRKHDTILRYVKGREKPVFNVDDVRVPYNPKTLVYRKYELEALKNGKGYGGINSGGNPRAMEDYERGKIVEDWWDDIPAGGMVSKHERTGYPTQKPEALLERIIKASSNEGDLVLDAFAGSGTTCAVAKKLGRNSICIDKNLKSCKIMEERLK
jgi:DNA modification methylase